MKTRFQYGLPGFSGKVGELTYCYDRRSGTVYARRYRYPKLKDNHHRMGRIAQNLFALRPSEEFKHDCRNYANAYARGKSPRQARIGTWSNCYLHLMYALSRAYPQIDLESLGREQIYAQDLPCISIKRAVEAGLLDPVPDYQRMGGTL